MKAALHAWGSSSNLFHQGVAKERADPDVIADAMAKPGVVLRRAVGSDGPFTEHAELPTHLGHGGRHGRAKAHRKAKERVPFTVDPAAEHKAALAFEKEQQRRERERRREEAARDKELEQRERAINRAQAALDYAERKHEKIARAIEEGREAPEKKSQAEDVRWEREKGKKLEAAFRRAKE